MKGCMMERAEPLSMDEFRDLDVLGRSEMAVSGRRSARFRKLERPCFLAGFSSLVSLAGLSCTGRGASGACLARMYALDNDVGRWSAYMGLRMSSRLMERLGMSTSCLVGTGRYLVGALPRFCVSWVSPFLTSSVISAGRLARRP